MKRSDRRRRLAQPAKLLISALTLALLASCILVSCIAIC